MMGPHIRKAWANLIKGRSPPKKRKQNRIDQKTKKNIYIIRHVKITSTVHVYIRTVYKHSKYFQFIDISYGQEPAQTNSKETAERLNQSKSQVLFNSWQCWHWTINRWGAEKETRLSPITTVCIPRCNLENGSPVTQTADPVGQHREVDEMIRAMQHDTCKLHKGNKKHGRKQVLGCISTPGSLKLLKGMMCRKNFMGP